MLSAGDVTLACPSDMRLVPAGSTALGSPEGVGEGDEHPARPIYLNTFCLDTYEFANQKGADVAAVMKTNPKFSTFQFPQSPSGYNGPKQPLIANWYQADAICRAQGKRLPTEAEWERAARGKSGTCLYGTKSCTELKSTEALFDSSGPTANVDFYPPNDFGLYGLAGNVGEWVSDWYQSNYYAYRGDNPQGPADGDSRRSEWKVLKGGSWYVNPALVRAANRNAARPAYSGNWGVSIIGFRCAASPIVVVVPVGK